MKVARTALRRALALLGTLLVVSGAIILIFFPFIPGTRGLFIYLGATAVFALGVLFIVIDNAIQDKKRKLSAP